MSAKISSRKANSAQIDRVTRKARAQEFNAKINSFTSRDDTEEDYVVKASVVRVSKRKEERKDTRSAKKEAKVVGSFESSEDKEEEDVSPRTSSDEDADSQANVAESKDVNCPPHHCPKDGKDGKNGRPGRDGKDGKPGCPGKNGKPGCPGKDGHNGKDGHKGKDGCDGNDGCDNESWFQYICSGGCHKVKDCASKVVIKTCEHVTLELPLLERPDKHEGLYCARSITVVALEGCHTVVPQNCNTINCYHAYELAAANSPASANFFQVGSTNWAGVTSV